MSVDGAQQVIVYDSPKQRAAIYDTAYTDYQVTRAIKNCVATYGTKANVRAMLASERAPEGWL